MTPQDRQAERFEESRGHLRAVAYKMLGSVGEADDAVQEAWIRFNRADTGDVVNLGGWLTTVVGRVCLDMLRSRTSRREVSLDEHPPGSFVTDAGDPEREALLTDAVGAALLVVLETLAPAERLAFVLHDLFGVPFDEIAAIVGRSPVATRQLASRARRGVQGAEPSGAADAARQREIVDAFLAASRGGNFGALLELLDPDVVLWADPVAARMGAPGDVRGARAVAEFFDGAARAARPALIDGAAGAAWAPGGTPRVVFGFTIADGKITAIDFLADPDHLAHLDVTILRREPSRRGER